MIEKRAFHRVPFLAKAILSRHDADLSGRLDNISAGGAMVRLGQDPLPSPDGNYLLSLYIDEKFPPLQLIVEVACMYFPEVGLKFTSIDDDTRERLELLISHIEKIKHHRDVHCKKSRLHTVRSMDKSTSLPHGLVVAPLGGIHDEHGNS